MARIDMGTIGMWAYFGGVLGALLLGLIAGFELFEIGAWMTALLVIAGLVIGFLNVSEAESVSFMVAAISVPLLSAVLGGFPIFGNVVASVLESIAKLSGPAALVVALTTIVRKAR